MRRLLAFVFILVAALSFAADKEVVIDPSGLEDYTTLTAAITGELAANADLTAGGLNGILTFTIQGNWSSPEGAKVIFNGFTTDATHYPVINVVAGSRHPGYWDDTKYRIDIDDASDWGIDILDDYVRVQGIQVRNIAATGYGGGHSQATGVIWDSCVFYDNGQTTAGYGIGLRDQGTDTVIVNCLADGNYSQGFQFRTVTNAKVYYSTAVNNTGAGFDTTNAPTTAYLKNCLAYNNTAGGFTESAPTLYLEYCASDDSTADNQDGDGRSGNNRVDQTFTFLSGTDFHLDPDDTGAVGYATSLATDPDGWYNVTTDVDGDTRDASTPDIGFDEAEESAGGSAVLMHYYQQQQ